MLELIIGSMHCIANGKLVQGHFVFDVKQYTKAAALSLLALTSASEASAQQALTPEQANALITPFYQALTTTSPDQVATTLESVTTPAWVSCGGNEQGEARDAVIARWTKRVAILPDMRLVPREVLVSGDKIIVRGEGTGTPSGDFLGVPHSGKSYRIMTIDIHSVEGGKMVRTHHLEDWLGATRQLAAK
jgi:predicted ester cyclase